MHVQAIDMKFGRFYDPFNMPHLVDGNSEFTIYMPGRNFEISARHDMWIKADTNRITITKPIAKLFQDGNIVDVDVYTQLFCFQYLSKINTVWCV